MNDGWHETTEASKFALRRARMVSHGARALHRSHGFLHGVATRFIEDRCLTGASGLSYATIVSLVPLTAIVLATFSGFPIFSDARSHFLRIIVDNFAPDIGDEAVAMFTSFATNAAQTTAVGVGGLIVTSILLLATIEEHLRPWRRARSAKERSASGEAPTGTRFAPA